MRVSAGRCSAAQGGDSVEVRLQTTARICSPRPHVDEHCTARGVPPDFFLAENSISIAPIASWDTEALGGVKTRAF